MDRPSLPGDPFAYRAKRDQERLRLAKLRLLRSLEQRLHHDLITDDYERQELRDRVLRLRRRLYG